MTVIKALDYGARIAGAVALLLGIALWTGNLYEYLNIHMAFGIAVVLTLWAWSLLALRQARLRVLGICGLVWGVLTIALGVAQTQLLVGEHHWIIQVIHLLLGLGAIAIASSLAGAVLQRHRATPQSATGAN